MITNETLKVIRQRRSVRAYKQDQIKEEELQAILEAGQYAPNAGDQEWHFTVIQNKEMLGRLNGIAKEFARQTSVEDLKALGEDEKSF
jgi:nitroreductase